MHPHFHFLSTLWPSLCTHLFNKDQPTVFFKAKCFQIISAPLRDDLISQEVQEKPRPGSPWVRLRAAEEPSEKIPTTVLSAVRCHGHMLLLHVVTVVVLFTTQYKYRCKCLQKYIHTEYHSYQCRLVPLPHDIQQRLYFSAKVQFQPKMQVQAYFRIFCVYPDLKGQRAIKKCSGFCFNRLLKPSQCQCSTSGIKRIGPTELCKETIFQCTDKLEQKM